MKKALIKFLAGAALLLLLALAHFEIFFQKPNILTYVAVSITVIVCFYQAADEIRRRNRHKR